MSTPLKLIINLHHFTMDDLELKLLYRTLCQVHWIKLTLLISKWYFNLLIPLYYHSQEVTLDWKKLLENNYSTQSRSHNFGPSLMCDQLSLRFILLTQSSGEQNMTHQSMETYCYVSYQCVICARKHSMHSLVQISNIKYEYQVLYQNTFAFTLNKHIAYLRQIFVKMLLHQLV